MTIQGSKKKPMKLGTRGYEVFSNIFQGGGGGINFGKSFSFSFTILSPNSVLTRTKRQSTCLLLYEF